jgi:anti-sigma factor RsiW
MVHPSEANLLALLHGELAPGEAAAVQAHLAECGDCMARADELHRSDEEIGRLLRALDHDVPRLHPPIATSRGRALRRAAIAAAAALFGAGVAAAAIPGTSLHRWIQGRLEVPREARSPAVAPPLREASPDEQAAGGIEVPAVRALTVSFTQPQRTGVLTVSVAPRPVVTLHAFGGGVGYQVGDAKIVVDNRRPAERYALEIPADLRRLTVMLGGRVIFQSDGQTAGLPANDTISLSTDSAE